MASNAISIPSNPPLFQRKLPIVLGTLAAGVGALFVCAHLSIAVVSALLIFGLSLVENETLLLLSVFLLPAAWVLQADLPLSNVIVPARYLLVFGFFLGRLLRGQVEIRRLCRHRLTRLSMLFFAVAAASVAFGSAGWTHFSARAITLLGSYMAFYFLILAWVDSLERLQRVVRTLFLSTLTVSVFGILQEIVGGYTSFWLYLYPPDDSFIGWNNRVPSFLGYSNVLAAYLNLILPLALACYFLGSGGWKRLAGWTAVLGSVTLALTQSRGGLVAFGCVLLLSIFSFIEKRSRQIAWTAALVAVGLSFYFMGKMLSPAHLGSIGREVPERLLFWATAWHLFLASPTSGIGFGNFPQVYGDYIPHVLIPPRVFTANGLYFQLLSEMGLTGMMSFLLLGAFAIIEGRRRLRTSSDFLSQALGFAVMGGVIATLMHGFVDLALDVSPQFGTLFWFMLGLVAASSCLGGSSFRRASLASGVS